MTVRCPVWIILDDCPLSCLDYFRRLSVVLFGLDTAETCRG